MKLAITGKGGVGKTTIASLLIKSLSGEGGVLAVDCDPDSNLGRLLGFRDAERIEPIVHMKEMIEERMGVEDGNRTFFKLNPKIDDIPEKFSRKKKNIKLIVMGAVEEGGSGCMCPESAFIKSLLSHLVLKSTEHLVMDMEAGVEHFGRGTAKSCDFVLSVVEPSLNSTDTAKRIYKLAKEIGIPRVYAVGNKVRSQKDIDFIKNSLGEIPLLEVIGYDEKFMKWDKGEKQVPCSEGTLLRIKNIQKILKEELA